MRGNDAYQIGDLTTGSAKVAGNYVSGNRVRLAGAGGSAAGMIAGAALLGPVGFVAGSILGSSAAQSSVTALSGDPKKKTDVQEQFPSQRMSGGNSSRSRGSQRQTLDLLSANPQTSVGAPSALLASTRNATSFEPLTNTETKLIGEMATVNHHTVMAQANVLSQHRPYQMEKNNYHPLSAPVPNITREPVAASNNRRKDVQHYKNDAPYFNSIESTRSNSLANTKGANVASLPAIEAKSLGFHDSLRSRDSGALRKMPQNVVRAPSNAQSRGSKQLYSQSNTISTYQQNTNDSNTPSSNSKNQASQGERGYRFGDITKSIVERGKQIDGRDANSGYKFVSDKR